MWSRVSNTPLLAWWLARILHEAGFPPGVVNLVLGPGSMGQAIVDDERVHGITFTGSVPVGVGSVMYWPATGECNLELGGHNPAIVGDDADRLDRQSPYRHRVRGDVGATDRSAPRRGASSRPPIASELTDRLISAVSALQVGDGRWHQHRPLVSPGA